jgi:hypothetical protein
MKLLMRCAVSFIAMIASTTAAVGSSGAAEAAAKPGVVVDYGNDPVVVKVKPKTIWPYSDLHYSNIHWTKLTNSTGYATAIRHINTCVPSCADANYRNDKVRLKFTRVRTTTTHKRVFTWLRVTVARTHKVSSHALPLKGYWE